MQKLYVEGLSNETRFVGAVTAVERRGAAEANWVLVEGDYGFGKSKLMMRHSLRTGSVFVRAKANWTAKWALTDIGDVLGLERQSTTQKQFAAVSKELMRMQLQPGFCLMVDEVNHCARDGKVIETLRDLTDTAELVMIAGGNKGISGQLRSHGAILGRVDQHVEILPATVPDVKLMCSALLPDVKVSDKMVEMIQHRCQGSLRLVMGALARVEVFAKRGRLEVTPETYGNLPLLSSDRTAKGV